MLNRSKLHHGRQSVVVGVISCGKCQHLEFELGHLTGSLYTTVILLPYLLDQYDM